MTVTQETSTFISTKSTSTIGQFITVVGWVNGAEGGSLALYDGDTLLSTYVLDSDEQATAFRLVAQKLSYDFQVRYLPPAATNFAPSVSTNRAVTVAKALPTVTAKAPTVRFGTSGRVYVTVAPINGVVPTGRVEIRSSTGTLLGAGNVSAATGKVTITLPKTLSRATRTLSVRYLGSTLFSARNTTVRFSII